MIKDEIIFSARYNILRNGGTYKQIYPAGTPEIWCMTSSELKLSMRGSFYDDNNFKDVDFLTDRLQIEATINGVVYPCGQYIITSEAYRKTDNIKTVELEGYCVLYLAQRKKLEERLYIPAGTLYTTQINALLIGAGIINFVTTPSAFTFAVDREDWEIGTPYLTIINDLLREINYNSAWVDMDNIVRITPYTSPSVNNITQSYSAGRYSIIGDDYTKSNDNHSKSNVFKVTCSNPELPNPLTATATNDDPASPFSTVNIGRVLHVENVDNTPNQAALQSTADTLKLKSLLTTETVEIVTAINPVHTAFDVLALANDDVTGIYSETEWSLSLAANADMRHKAKRVIM